MVGRKSKEREVPAAEGTLVASAIPLRNLPPASLGGLGAVCHHWGGSGDNGAALPGGPGGLQESQTPTLQVVLEDDDQHEVAGSQRTQYAAGTGQSGGQGTGLGGTCWLPPQHGTAAGTG